MNGFAPGNATQYTIIGVYVTTSGGSAVLTERYDTTLPQIQYQQQAYILLGKT
jgi:hypothetical protein